MEKVERNKNQLLNIEKVWIDKQNITKKYEAVEEQAVIRVNEIIEEIYRKETWLVIRTKSIEIR